LQLENSEIQEEFYAKISSSLRKLVWNSDRAKECQKFLSFTRKYPLNFIEYLSCYSEMISEEVMKTSQNTLRFLRCGWHAMETSKPLPNLRKLHLENSYCYNLSGIDLQETFPNLREIFLDQCGWDNYFKAFLQLKSIQTIIVRSYNNAKITAQNLVLKHPSTLKHLHLGALCTMKSEGFLNVARACPNLESFTVSYVDLTKEDINEFRKLTPKLKFGQIKIQASNKPWKLLLLDLGDENVLPKSVQHLLSLCYF